MKPGTIRQILSILSGAFDAAKRWKWVTLTSIRAMA